MWDDRMAPAGSRNWAEGFGEADDTLCVGHPGRRSRGGLASEEESRRQVPRAVGLLGRWHGAFTAAATEERGVEVGR